MPRVLDQTQNVAKGPWTEKEDATLRRLVAQAVASGIERSNMWVIIGNRMEDGTRKHWGAGEDQDDSLADPEHIAAVYLQLHRQHRSTWGFEVILRPWKESW